jgi:nucleotide-binding universal stress UspA family protein
MFKLEQLLVPVDFSETSERALDYALELARRVGADVALVHVYQLPVWGFPDGAIVPAADLASQLSVGAQRSLDQCVERRAAPGASVRGFLREGVPWEEINELARALHADLIVIGTHGRRGIARALLGSVAETVVRTAEVPVLVIRGATGEGA